MKNLLVTGGCGFIGSNFVHYLLKNFDDLSIINLDKLTYAGNPENLREVESLDRYTFIKGDICDEALVEKIFSENEIDTVVHFAAESHVDRSIEGPLIFINTNVLGTQVLLEAAKKNWEKEYTGKRFLHVSTDEVYGSLGKEGYFTETTNISPNSPYSASKASSDLLVRSYFKTFGFPAMITRCSNNYGPYQYPEKLIPLMIKNALNDIPLPVYGDGKNVRDWLYVEDHCSAIVAVLSKGKLGEVYNIGGNNEKENIEIVALILEKLGKPDSLIRYVTDRLGHDKRYAIDATKIKKACGWTPKTDFSEGIEKTINWYLNNKSWWEKLLVV